MLTLCSVAHPLLDFSKKIKNKKKDRGRCLLVSDDRQERQYTFMISDNTSQSLSLCRINTLNSSSHGCG